MDKIDQKIQESFDKLGLSKSEQEVLMFLLETKSEWPISAIAGELEMPRQTVNSTLKRLIKNGMVHEIKQKGVSLFLSDATQLSNYTESQCKMIQEATRTILDASRK